MWGIEAPRERGNVKLRYPVVGVLVGVAVFATVALAGGSGPKTKLVSRASNGDPAANGYSYPGGITPNGRWVPFESDADNLPGATGDYQVYVRDRKTGSTKLVSKSNSGDPGDDDSYDASISDDGRFIAFESYASNLPGSLGPTYLQAYVRDLKNGHHEVGQQAGRRRSGDRRIQQRRLDLGQRASGRLRVRREQPPGQRSRPTTRST